MGTAGEKVNPVITSISDLSFPVKFLPSRLSLATHALDVVTAAYYANRANLAEVLKAEHELEVCRRTMAMGIGR